MLEFFYYCKSVPGRIAVAARPGMVNTISGSAGTLTFSVSLFADWKAGDVFRRVP